MSAIQAPYKFISLSIKLIIIAGAFWFIYQKVFNRSASGQFRETIGSIFSGPNFPLLAIVLSFMLLNWGLEAVKWRILMSKIEDLTFWTSLNAVFAGVTISVFTPNRIGESGGRIFFLQKADKVKGILLSFVGSFSQLIVTIIAGAIAFLYYSASHFTIQPATLFYKILSLFTITVIAALLFFYFNVSTLGILGTKNRKIRNYLEPFSLYSTNDLGKILLLSVFRYILFSIQFYMLLQLFHVDLFWKEGLLMIWLTFFTTTIIPSIAIADLGIRGSAALLFIGRVSDNHEGIVAASLLLWFINIAIPAITGALCVLRLNFFNKE